MKVIVPLVALTYANEAEMRFRNMDPHYGRKEDPHRRWHGIQAQHNKACGDLDKISHYHYWHCFNQKVSDALS